MSGQIVLIVRPGSTKNAVEKQTTEKYIVYMKENAPTRVNVERIFQASPYREVFAGKTFSSGNLKSGFEYK